MSQENNALNTHLRLFETLRDQEVSRFPSPKDRLGYADAIAHCFMPCAKHVLAGHFKVLSRKIYPTAIELYYHEEGAGRFKDPIMYHTNDRKLAEHEDYFINRGITELPYFPFGSLHPHTSGIDVTFENPQEQYRASLLIREYEVDYGDGKRHLVKNSTDIYDDMLVAGIPLENLDWIEWCDGEMLKEEDIVRRWRRNVPDYRQVEGRWVKNTEGEPSFVSSGVRYAKCPFDWQFARK